MSTTDFDFFQGEWIVANRRLKDFLDERSGWEEFTAVSRASRHFDGGANFDEIAFPTMGFKGLTLRLYDTEREEWSLYWSNDRRGVLDPPVVGGFGADGRGVFYGDDTYQGKDIRVRFLWSDITETTATWEQAFSVDGEKTWLTNWVMELVRRA
ncbi:hypothetical protein [Streptomyces sp.]|uniref:hypothetical protein n=1 Tax=Streptomyces sp. TaxID=1931 RepID=UPI002D76DE59|nr:hypothetical protein [Streptomyces sp.]HET6353014.1 hypothetical protein [Streptomyces sp.]